MGRRSFIPWDQEDPAKLKARREGGKRRAMALRWQAKARATVTHETYGTVIVPHASPFAAMLCACDLWGCSYGELDGAVVRGVRNTMITITMQVNAPADQAEGIKEDLAVYCERYGDAKILEVKAAVPQQMSMTTEKR